MTEEEKIVQEENVEQEEVREEVQEELTFEEKQERKIKNLISLVVLLVGLFVGSLFVDIAQMFRGEGFSQKVLNGADIFQTDNKTWVAYSEPMVKVQVLTDDTCEACNPDEALLSLRRVMPTMLAEKIDANSETGKALLEKLQIKTLPALVFAKEVEKTELYAQAQQFFDSKEGLFILKTAEIGLPVGKYVQGPTVNEGDAQIGAKDAGIRLVEFVDFQNAAAKKYYDGVLKNAIKDYADRVDFVFKQFPLETSAQAKNASLASLCANEQGKFAEYAEKLFAGQSDWGSVKDAKNTQKFKTYATQLKLDAQQFNKCLDEQKYQDNVAKDQQEGQSFAVAAVPTVFIGSEAQNLTLKYEDLKKVLDEALTK